MGGVDARWLAMNINGNAGRQQILDHAKTSSGLHTINSRVVAELLIAVPTIEEQQEIVEVYAALEGRLDSERSCLNGLIALKSALMSALLTGEVRVKADPEPA
jgi:type I restriction enzyme, S subunit